MNATGAMDTRYPTPGPPHSLLFEPVGYARIYLPPCSAYSADASLKPQIATYTNNHTNCCVGAATAKVKVTLTRRSTGR